MDNTLETQIAIVSEQLADLQEDVTEIKRHVIHGNGIPSLLHRVTRLEGRRDGLSKKEKGALASALVNSFGALLLSLIDLL